MVASSVADAQLASPQPLYLVFAGVNGAGKSTLYRSGIWHSCAGGCAGSLGRVNPDEIALARGCGPVEAGKIALAQIAEYFDAGASFCQETTLCGRSAANNIHKARELGYRVVVLYVGLASPELAIERIKHRVSVGGHDIHPDTVRRRYDASIVALSKVVHECDEAVLFDNTTLLCTIARWRHGTLRWWGGLKAANSWLPDALSRGVWG